MNWRMAWMTIMWSMTRHFHILTTLHTSLHFSWEHFKKCEIKATKHRNVVQGCNKLNILITFKGISMQNRTQTKLWMFMQASLPSHNKLGIKHKKKKKTLFLKLRWIQQIFKKTKKKEKKRKTDQTEFQFLEPELSAFAFSFSFSRCFWKQTQENNVRPTTLFVFFFCFFYRNRTHR